jgi:hypothetical protein
LNRKSVAEVKQFIGCLDGTVHKDVIQRLTEVGVIVRICTTVAHPKLSVEDQIKIQKHFVRSFDSCKRSLKDKIATKIREYMKKIGHEIMSVKMEDHVAWYIMCRTVQSLEHLRLMYVSPSRQLANVLQYIFNCLHDGDIKLQLSVEWNRGDYASCTSFLTGSSVERNEEGNDEQDDESFVTESLGRPFELLRDGGEAGKMPEGTVSTNCVLTTMKLVFPKTVVNLSSRIMTA